MKGVVRSLLLFLCTTLFIMSASVCVCVVRVHADVTATYLPYSANDCTYFTDGTYNPKFIANGNGRLVFIKNNANSNIRQMTAYYVTDTIAQAGIYNNSCGVPDGSLLYVYNYYIFTGDTDVYGMTKVNEDIPIHVMDSSIGNGFQNAIYWTYGEGAVDPVEPVTWGLIDLEGYQTNVAGQGNASINNVDVISWNDTFDTNSNDISTGNVRVRYVPGYYRATSKQNLLAQTYQDFVLDIISAVNGDVYPVSDGSASFRWGDVIGSLSIPFYSIYNLTNSTEGWLKRGWIYEVRLEIDDYIGEWQTVYSSTSSGVENDMTIVNTTVVTQETITAIQNINSINGTTNIWIIYGQPVDPNPEVIPPEDDDEKPWWVYLLEMINNTLGIQNEYINEGTDESIEVVNNFEEDHDDLNVTVNDYDDIENNIVNDMNDNLDDLDIESDLIENNSFLSSARWVAEQYTRITTDNPIGSILKFSLVLGFVMIFLGRFK